MIFYPYSKPNQKHEQRESLDPTLYIVTRNAVLQSL